MAFLEKMKEYLDKGVEVSKDALSKAGDAVQNFSEKSVTKIETHQLQSRQNKEYRALGLAVYQFFEDNPSGCLSSTDGSISGIIQEIERLAKEIKVREETLKEDDNVKSSNDEKTRSTDNSTESTTQAENKDTENVSDVEFVKVD